MPYADPTNDNTKEVEQRIYPGQTRCLKLATDNTGVYKLLPRNIKVMTIYAEAAHYVRFDLVSADPTAAKTLTATKDNVIYIPAGTFVQAQGDEFNCVSAVTVTGTSNLYFYTGNASDLNGLVAEDVVA